MRSLFCLNSQRGLGSSSVTPGSRRSKMTAFRSLPLSTTSAMPRTAGAAALFPLRVAPPRYHAFRGLRSNDRTSPRRDPVRSSERDRRRSPVTGQTCRQAADCGRLRVASCRRRKHPVLLFRRGRAPVSVYRVVASLSRVRGRCSQSYAILSPIVSAWNRK
jgi:hypothetical protein